MTRNDLILIAVLVILSLTPLAVTSHAKTTAVVKVDGSVVREINLSSDETFTVEAVNGFNVVEVRGGKISVVAADCPEKICVRRGAINRGGEVIACVPHKLLIEIAGD